MRNGIVLALLLVLASVAPLSAQENLKDKAPAGRYTMSKTDDGFLRLDTETGTVSHCVDKAGSWICRSVADDRKAYEDEIARLQKLNSQLNIRLNRLQNKKTGAKDDYPTDEQVDKALGYMEKLFRKMLRIARELGENVQGKNNDKDDSKNKDKP
jgi:hypothetical protein